MPGDSGSMLTSNPGFGVAQSTSTPDAENDIAAVPPIKVKVCVVAVVDVAGGTDAVDGEEDTVVDDDVWLDAGGVVIREVDEVLDGGTVAGAAT